MVEDNGERWQVYDEHGKPVAGHGISKPEAAAGALHGSSHIWIWRGEGEDLEVLLQRRAYNKQTWPGYLDISVGGHVDLDEAPAATALRETQEELGFAVALSQLKPLFTYRAYYVTQPHGYIENEWQFVYGLHLPHDVEFTHDDEVEGVVWLTLPAFRELTAGKTTDKIVPHAAAYFAQLLQALQGASA